MILPKKAKKWCKQGIVLYRVCVTRNNQAWIEVIRPKKKPYMVGLEGYYQSFCMPCDTGGEFVSDMGLTDHDYNQHRTFRKLKQAERYLATVERIVKDNPGECSLRFF